MKTSSFTDLLSNNYSNINMNMDDFGDANVIQNQESVPKFKSVTPPSLPLENSQTSSYFPFTSSTFSPTEFLNSSLFLSSPNIFASPTIEAFAGHSFNNKEDEKNFSEFSFQTQTKTSSPSQAVSNFYLFDHLTLKTNIIF